MTYRLHKSFNRRECRSSSKLNRPDYQHLEPRQLLAAVLYVDFGIGNSELAINNAEAQTLNGPQIFGSGVSLGSLQTAIENTGLDLNLDAALSNSDTTDFTNQVLANLDEIFEVFDVTIQQVTSANVAEVAEKLAEQSTSDAYIYVGGARPSGFGAYGASVLDVGNASDNFGVVFGGDIINYWDEFEFRNEGQEFTFNSQFLDDFDVATYGSWSIANSIAKQAAVTFGVQTTEARPGKVLYDVMLQPGSDASGVTDFQPTWGQPRTFSRFANDLTLINGVSPGTQNSFETLESSVGLKANAPYYVTMQLSDSTDYDQFEVRISSTSSGSLRIEVGGVVFAPTLAEIEHGLIFNGGFVDLTGNFANTRFNTNVILGQLPDHEVKILNVRRIDIDQSLDFGDDGVPARNIFRSRSERIPIIGNTFYGTINQNISYRNALELHGDEGNDIFRAFERTDNSNIDLSKEKVAASINSHFFYRGKEKFVGGGGNDIFILNRQILQVNGGDGEDYLRLDGGRAHQEIGGEGYDVRETIGLSSGGTPYADDVRVFFHNGLDQLVDSPDGLRVGNNGFERFVFDTETRLTVSTQFGQDLVIIHNGNQTIMFDPVSQKSTLIVGGVDEYQASGNAFFVRSTTADVIINSGQYIQLSSEFDPKLGHTDNIRHKLTLAGKAANPHVVVGAKAGSGVQSIITTKFLSGVTANSIVFGDQFFPAITIHGSDTAADYVVIAESFKNIHLMGNGGNDIFTVGYAFGGQALLNRVRGNLQLDGGAGNDYLFFQDSEASNLRITNRHVHKLANAGQNPPTFGLAGYSGFENLRTDLSWLVSPTSPHQTITVFGSGTTTYHLNLTSTVFGGATQPRTDELVLIGGNDARTFITNNNSNFGEPIEIRGGVWVFTNGFIKKNPIFVNRINRSL